MRRSVFAVFAGWMIAAASCRGALPPAIQDEAAASPHGVATVVFFTDFQCPFCRRTHEALAPLVAEHNAARERVRVVFKHVPLPSHPDARTAARAAVCVEKLAPHELHAFTRALARSRDLGPNACASLAVEHAIDEDAYRRCVDDAATTLRIERDIATFEAVSGDGVPLLFVGARRLEGAQSRAELEQALDAALHDAR